MAGRTQGTEAAASGGSADKWSQIFAANMQARRLWTMGDPARGIPPAVNMWQRLNPQAPANPQPGNVLTCTLRNVGLIKRVLVEINGTITTAAGAGDNVAITPFGLANLISNVTFYDLANNQRINTAGWHLVSVATSKRHRPYGSAVTTDTPFGYGDNYAVIDAPNTIAGSATAINFKCVFEVPFVRRDSNLKGAIWGAVSTAVMTLTVTLNPGMFVSNVGDPTLAVYKNASSANLPTLSNLTWQVAQNFLDPGQMKLPLPALDIGSAYLLNSTTSGLPVVNLDNALPFVNQRRFLSLTAIFDNAGNLRAGTDVNYWRLTSANFTNILDYDPQIASLMSRLLFGDDMPTGGYFFDFSDRPIDTDTYGNMQMILNPSLVSGASATVLQGFEAYGTIGAINQAGAIPSGF